MNNQERKIRPEIMNLNLNEPFFYPYNIKISRCKGSCNTINDPYAKICVTDQIKNTNVKVFNLILGTNKKKKNGIKLVNGDVDKMQTFVTINKDRIMTNADKNVKN